MIVLTIQSDDIIADGVLMLNKFTLDRGKNTFLAPGLTPFCRQSFGCIRKVQRMAA